MIESDPMQTTRNKFRLERPSLHADFELRVETLRVFYRVDDEGDLYITLIGKKVGDQLIVEERVFQL